MLAVLSSHSALRILMMRAVVLFVLVTIVVAAFRVDSPFGVVLLVGVLGWLDIGRRRETLFWANLGYSAWQTTGVVAAVALVAESVVAIWFRPLFESAMRNAR